MAELFESLVAQVLLTGHLSTEPCKIKNCFQTSVPRNGVFPTNQTRLKNSHKTDGPIEANSVISVPGL